LETQCFNYKIIPETVHVVHYNNIVYKIKQEINNNNNNNKFKNNVISVQILTQDLVFHFMA